MAVNGSPQPSPELVDLLQRLGLASPQQVHAVRRRARGLSKSLPLFDSVWVDALVGVRLLSPFQAAEINAGRGERLAVDAYVLSEPVLSLGYAECFAAREIATRRPVWLAIARQHFLEAKPVASLLSTLVERLGRVEAAGIVPIEAAGVDARRAWAACLDLSATPAADWMVRNGRFSPEVVLEIARQMAAALAELDGRDLVHGDLSAAGLLLDPQGAVLLPMAGLRGIVRPEEGYALADLPPHSFDYLAPERVAAGTPPSAASDLYACGCLWWHLLTGRPPLAGGNSLSKLKAAHAARIPDPRRLAPETPTVLAAAITACTQAEPNRRPDSFAQLAASLGPSTGQGRVALSACLVRRAPRRSSWSVATHSVRHSRHAPVWLAAAAGCLLMLSAITWPSWGHSITAPLAQIWADPPPEEKGPPALAHNPLTTPGDGSERDRSKITTASSPPAAAQQPDPLPLPAPSSQSPPEDLVVSAGQAIDGSRLQLRAGQTVRPADGQRAMIVVPRAGLRVEVEGVRFESIDFVTRDASPAEAASASSSVLIDLRAAKAEFLACSFQPHDDQGHECLAITWSHRSGSRPADQLSGAAHLRLTDCVLRGVRVGVDCRDSGPLLVEVENTLHLGPGPLWRLNQVPALDEPIQVVLRRCTLRGADSLGDLAYSAADKQAGQVSIEATDCVFAPREAAALLRLLAPKRQDQLLHTVQWAGEGSLLQPGVGFAAWYNPAGGAERLDDSSVAIDGLVSAQFNFAADTVDRPPASEIVSWAAPLRSEEPPGIQAAKLYLPTLAIQSPAR